MEEASVQWYYFTNSESRENGWDLAKYSLPVKAAA
jgi:hypothetical protein